MAFALIWNLGVESLRRGVGEQPRALASLEPP